MSNRRQLVRQTAAVLMAPGLIVDLLPRFAVPGLRAREVDAAADPNSPPSRVDRAQAKEQSMMRQMTRTLCVLPLLLATATATAQAETTLHVSPQGDDANAGTAADAALRTPAAAQQRLRELRDDDTPGPFTVVLHDGVYRLDDTLTFTVGDGGTADEPVTWRAAEGAEPVLSGGTRLPDTWQAPDEGNIWTLELDDVAAGHWYFHQLWIDGRRATRARYPNEGYLGTAGPLPHIENPREHRGDREASLGFRYREGDLQQWDHLDDVNIFLFHAWTASLHWIKELDTDANEVHFVNPNVWPVGWWDREDQRYYVENFLEALDAPGQWYLDRESGVLHYWPREDQDLTAAEVYAPRLRQLVRVEGDGEAGDPVEGLRFEGIAFQHADWAPEREQTADGQSVSFATAAVHVSAARHVTFERCEIAHVGEHGIWFAQGTQHSTLRQTRVHDLGAGAVRIGEPSSPSHDWQAVEYNVVDNCFLHNGGNVFPAGCGILLQRASHNEITHNEISDFYYTGISVGWSWGYAESSAHHNIVRYNHVHHLGWGVLSDMGGIYTLGDSPGTQITHNIFHHIRSYSYGGWGLYTDEGSTGIVMSHNLVYNTQTGGFHQHYGRDNVISNNILAFSATHQLQRTRVEDHNSFTFENNIVLFDNANLLRLNWADDNFTMRDNVYWDTSGEPLDFNGHSFEQWQARGHDEGSAVADPRFARPDFSDREQRPLSPEDFELRDDSPALERGFEPLELDRVGLYGDKDWVSLPETIDRPRMTFETTARVREHIDDFEDYAVGDRPAGASAIGVTGGAEIAVTDAIAATGTQSLRFADAPDLPHRWHPHLFYTLDLRRGEAVSRFDLRRGDEAELSIEWRDRASPYRTGPRLTIAPDGALRASGGDVLLHLPADQWVNFELTARLGTDSDGTYDLSVTLPGESPHRFKDVPFQSDDFRRFQWFGISSMATDTREFFLDNLEIRLAR
ncbi:MAG: right-handed parallel beta-helix repeat-containing protein [Planctomycetaceae bacterium]|nr:MAG: right-handed parallel beta-helix repeat-containing protein [Planctomycetaceae bacterium]